MSVDKQKIENEIFPLSKEKKKIPENFTCDLDFLHMMTSQAMSKCMRWRKENEVNEDELFMKFLKVN
jgi:hypothetical protein